MNFHATFTTPVNAVIAAILMTLAGAIITTAATTMTTTTTSTSNIIMGRRLVKASYCEGQVLARSQRYSTAMARSKVECVSQCHPDTACVSVVYEMDTKLCHLGNAKALDNCTNMEAAASGVVFYQEPPPCGANEVRGPNGLCVCAPGFAGNPCVRYYHDCSDIKLYGDWKNEGVYTIYPPLAPKPVQVYCRHISSTRTYLLDRRKNDESFDRPFNDYRNGFGDPTSDHWIGLENIYALTADRPYEMRVNLKVQNNTNYLIEYKDFKVTDEASGYRLIFNKSLTVSPTDCLLPLHNVKFSTKDHDRDQSSSVHCAQIRKGGFWYLGDSCSTCNPHGLLKHPANGKRVGSDDEAFWTDLLGDVALFKVSMYLLPVLP